MNMSDNDIDALLEAFDPIMLMKTALCSITTDELEDIINKMGKTVINIGEGLTLLHQAAQFGRPDLLEILLEKGHPLEVCMLLLIVLILM